MTVAYLAPELPASSETFVWREIDAHRAAGLDVAAFSLRRPTGGGVPADVRARFADVDALYSDPARFAADALRHCVARPLASLRTLLLAARDFVRGGFRSRGARWRVPLQAFAGLALARRLRRRGARHLHAHFIHAPATVAMYAASAAGIGFSCTAHARDLFVEGSLLPEKLRRAAFVVAISECNRAFLAERAPASAARVVVVRCGVDAAALGRLADLRVEREAAISQARAPFRVVSVCRLVRKKGVDVLLRALAALVAEGRDATATIAGDGPEGAALRRLAEELGIADRVRFLGRVEASEVPSLLAAADAAAMACRVEPDGDRDGVPVALMEAAAAGVPVVATRVSGLPELVSHDETGLLTSPDDPAATARALARLCDDAGLRARLAAGARRRVAEEFDAAANAARLRTRFAGAARSSQWSSRGDARVAN